MSQVMHPDWYLKPYLSTPSAQPHYDNGHSSERYTCSTLVGSFDTTDFLRSRLRILHLGRNLYSYRKSWGTCTVVYHNRAVVFHRVHSLTLKYEYIRQQFGMYWITWVTTTSCWPITKSDCRLSYIFWRGETIFQSEYCQRLTSHSGHRC